jgi:hypothetical protein
MGTYCGGVIVQILDDHDLGSDWQAPLGSGMQQYNHSVVASIDTLLSPPGFQSIQFFFPKDSIFYFQYTEGGYANKAYVLCEPTPSITIKVVSTKPCQMNGDKQD